MEKVAFLYATFPRPTETFVRRELRALRDLGCEAQPFSLWGGDPEWREITIELFPKWKLLSLIFWIPFWAFCRPQPFVQTLKSLWSAKCPNLQNFNETFLGLGFALVQARSFAKNRFCLIHGVWATMPATAAFAISRLTGIPFSMGAHAYDLFRKGGDWLLLNKLQSSSFVRTSSKSSAERLKRLGVSEHKIKLIRRGLEFFSKPSELRLSVENELRLIAVGRLVPKKGYFKMLEIASSLMQRGLSFELRIVGDGSLKKPLEAEIKRRALCHRVSLLGMKSEEEVRSLLLDADAMIFCGIIDAHGDRDGIPNVIPEAMDAGCLVLSSFHAGASEAFVDGVSGFSLDPEKPLEWVQVLEDFSKDPGLFSKIRRNAIQHVRDQFDVVKTASALGRCIRQSIQSSKEP